MGQRFPHAFVETFVTAADQQQMLLRGQLTGDGLVERPARRRQQNHPRLSARQMLHGFKDRFGFQQHPRPAAERFIVHRAMAVMGVVPQIVDRQVQQPFCARPFDDAFIERPREHCREQSQHVDFHGRANLPGADLPGPGSGIIPRVVPRRTRGTGTGKA